MIANWTRTYVDRAVERGATEVATARAVAEGSDIVMLCMDTSDNVEARMRGDDGVIAGLKPGAVVIDFGTSLPSSTNALGEEVEAAGGTMLDCPIGRTPMHAKDGLLNLMGSGDKAAFDKVKPVLDDLGENVFHLGPLGTGHTIKLINNFYAQACANAMAESYAIADVMGVDRQGLYDVMSAGPLKSGMMDFVTAYALQGDDQQLAFSIKNAAKDVGYYAQMCSDAGVQSMMSGSTLDSLRGSIDAGRGEDMVPLQVDFFADRFKG